MPSPEQAHGVARRLFSGLAASYDRTVDYATFFQDRYWKRWAAEKIALSEGSLVLDLGCGTLLFEERLPRRNRRFVGLDLSPEMTRLGWAKGLANVPLVINGDAERLPFADETFDAAVSCYVPKYVGITRLAGELARVVRPGARVVLYDFAKPTGISAPILGLYVQVGLRAIGFALRKIRSGAALAFERLPEIVDETSWDKEVENTMEASGFETLAATPLTAGAVFAYCGRRRPG
jgi:demethylmenaquinone methyltransferase / 2-methoxy-6-polyprenyl-1,4-benzoquinol methylase